MEKVISGIRPTGNLHLGNYFGAVKSFLQMQNDYNCYFFIADWHSLTTRPKPENIVNSARTILAEYLACGLDPEKSTIYVQSDVKEVLELYLFLNMNAYLGELERCTTFKEKARKQRLKEEKQEEKRKKLLDNCLRDVNSFVEKYDTLRSALPKLFEVMDETIENKADIA